MRRQKVGVVVSAILCACLLSACSITISSNSSSSSSASSESSSSGASYSEQDTHDESTSTTSTSTADDNDSDKDSNLVTTSPSTSDDTANDEMGTEAVHDGSEGSTDTEGLVKYDSVYDVPFIELGIANDGKDLTKNGQMWVSTPGTQRFGNLCFTDGKTLYIQCFLSENPEEGFRWFWVCFDHWHEDALEFLPEETYNKLFDRADGYTLYTDDGYQYTVTPCEVE